MLFDLTIAPHIHISVWPRSYRDIDLFTGAVYETPVDGGVVGPTFAYLLGEQFRRLRVGDRFFYETSDSQLSFTSGTSGLSIVCDLSFSFFVSLRHLRAPSWQTSYFHLFGYISLKKVGIRCVHNNYTTDNFDVVFDEFIFLRKTL